MLLAVGWRVGTRRPPRGPAMMLILPPPAPVTRNFKTNHPEDGGMRPEWDPREAKGWTASGCHQRALLGQWLR